MDTEKDLLKRDLSKAETKGDIAKIVEDAELMGHEDIVELAKQKLEALSVKAQSVETTPPAQVAQVESMGSLDEVKKRTKEVDTKIDAVKVEATARIAEVQGETPSTSVPELKNPSTSVNEHGKKEGLFSLITDTFETKQQLTDRMEKTMIEIAKQLQKYEQDLNQAQDSINSVKAMKPGSREKYDASYDMMHKVREKFEPLNHIPTHTVDVKGNMDSVRIPAAYRERQGQYGKMIDVSLKEDYISEIQAQYKPKLEVVERKFNDLKLRETEILKEMKDVMDQAKEEYSKAA